MTRRVFVKNSKIKFWQLLVIVMFTPMVVSGTAVSFSLQVPEEVVLGERFRVVFSVNQRPENFHPPAFEGFRIVSGPAQSSSASVQIVNGQVNQQETHSFTYILEAIRVGTLVIGRASVTVDGRRYSTESMAVRVADRATTRGADSRLRQDEPISRITEEDLFVRATASNSNPFIGQQIVVTYRLFTRIPVSQFVIEESPGFQGFWAEDITPQGEPKVSQQVINGIRYTVAIIRQLIVYPQRAGRLIIEPLQVNTVVRVEQPRASGNFFDDFFNDPFFGNYQSLEHPLSSNSLQITARPLPEANRPVFFNGAVGQFRLQATLSTDTVQVGEPVTLTVNIAGSGNLNLIQVPQMEFANSVETFGTEVTDQFSTTLEGISGSRKFETVLIPRSPGILTLDTLHFSAFNPVTGTFENLSKDPMQLVAIGSVEDEPHQNRVAHETEVDFLNADIRFIHTDIFPLQHSDKRFYMSAWFFGKMGLLLLAFSVILIINHKYRKNHANLVLLKHRKAHKIALKCLGNAQKAFKNGRTDEFYDEVFKALWGYISDKLFIPVSKLSKDEVREYFKKHKVSEEIVQVFFDVLDHCEFARFAPRADVSDPPPFYKKALDVLVALEKKLSQKNS